MEIAQLLNRTPGEPLQPAGTWSSQDAEAALSGWVSIDPGLSDRPDAWALSYSGPQDEAGASWLASVGRSACCHGTSVCLDCVHRWASKVACWEHIQSCEGASSIGVKSARAVRQALLQGLGLGSLLCGALQAASGAGKAACVASRAGAEHASQLRHPAHTLRCAGPEQSSTQLVPGTADEVAHVKSTETASCMHAC